MKLLHLLRWAIDMKLMIQWAITSSALILVVLGVRYLFRETLSNRIRYALWGVVLLRLLVPFQMELPANTSAALPLLATNLVPELPTALERPVSPDTAATFIQIPAERLEERQPNGNPVFSFTAADLLNYNPENNFLYVYQGGFTLGDMAVSLWLVGVGAAGAVMLASNLRFYGRLRKRRQTLEGTDTPIPIYVMEGLPSPCLFGVLRPAVYVTPAAAERPDTLRHVLAHELTHYRHRDHIWSVLRCLALAFHWYNPLVWLAVLLSKRDGELACDEGAVARLGEGERIPYGRTLVDMVAARSLRTADLLSCSTAMTGGKKSIQQRVARIVKRPETVKTALFAAMAMVALAAVFVFAGRGDSPVLSEYQDTVERATSVAYLPASPASTGSTIVEEDSVNQVKEILRAVSPVGAGGSPDLSDASSAPSVFLFGTYETNGLMQVRYTLLPQNGRTYVLVWASQPDGSTGYEVVGCLPDTACSQLEELAWEQPEEQTGFAGFNQFLANVESARSILVGRAMHSSAGPMPPITGPEALAQAKKLLSRGMPMGQLEDGGWMALSFSSDSRDMGYWRTVAQEELGDMLFMRGNAIVLCPDPEYQFSEGHQYFLSQEDGGGCMLLQWYPERAEDPIRPLAAYSQDVYSQLEALAWGQDAQSAGHSTLEDFRLEIESCLRIRLSFDSSLPAITDPGLLDQARAVLLHSGCLELEDSKTGNVELLVKDGTAAWLLFWIDNQTILEELRALGKRQKELLLGDLTQEQVDRANEAFQADVFLPDGGTGPSEISCFFTSSYDDPTQIDLEEFLRYCPLSELVGETADREEYRDVLKASFWDEYSAAPDFLLPTPMHRYPREKVSALLEKYTGVSVDQLDWGEMLYLEEYDAFYNFTSDYGPGFFTCAGGQITEDTVLLWSEPDFNGSRCELTLRKSGENWLIQSHHTIYER